MRKLKVNPKLIPEVNIGMLGHVAHGKTSLTEAITGKRTLTHSEELKRGITIRLGYADASFYKCTNCGKYSTSIKCPYCFSDTELQRTVSFIDAPGHETLMATVLTGAALMDGAILVIDATQKCPQPQTREHLKALELIGIKNVIIVQSKIDLVSEEQAIKNYEEIKDFIKDTTVEKAPIIPVSSQHRINIDAVIEAIEKFIPTPKRDESKEFKMFVARSFDINKPGTGIKNIVGGVLGGSIIQGKVKVGDEVEIRPGVRMKEKYKPLFTRVAGLQKAKFDLEEAGPGGLLGMLTELDPALTKADSLVGNVVGHVGELPEAVEDLEIEINLLERVVGTEDLKKMNPIRVGEALMVNAGTTRSVGVVSEMKKDKIKIELKIPVCVEKSDKIVISRQIEGRWRLVGYGVVQ
ncbi:MAG: translation initiation factor IF-2 subunit gamma [Candidatus Aenigmatarchaeota archaeon]